MKKFLVFCVILFALEIQCQPAGNYDLLVAKAGLLHLQGNSSDAIRFYEQAFLIKKPDALTAYKAAGMYALQQNENKAFEFLEAALDLGWTQSDWLAADPYFTFLSKSYPDRWQNLLNLAEKKEREYAESLQLPQLRKEIMVITNRDQLLRYRLAQTTNDSISTSIRDEISKSDFSNLTRAKEIVQKYGWPKISQIGKDGQNNLWLIVQHADQDIHFQQIALKNMYKLWGTKELNIENYAYLYDRVQSNLNYKQLYGTQVIWKDRGMASAFRPILLEYDVDKRRKKTSLQPLSIYAASYGFSYEPISKKDFEKAEYLYNQKVQSLVKSAQDSFLKKDFDQTYDYYNQASTFAGGMSEKDNFEAAVIFASIAGSNSDQKYKNISLDFLNLLYLRNTITKSVLEHEPAFKVLHEDDRWKEIFDGVEN
jgi:hypothetical protein